MSRWATALRPRALTRVTAVAGITALCVFTLQYHRLEWKNPKVQGTLAIERVARTVHAAVGDDFPLTYVDTPFALQLEFESLRPPVSFSEAAVLLRADPAAFVVVDDVAKL